jgi:hypothetical protein
MKQHIGYSSMEIKLTHSDFLALKSFPFHPLLSPHRQYDPHTQPNPLHSHSRLLRRRPPALSVARHQKRPRSIKQLVLSRPPLASPSHTGHNGICLDPPPNLTGSPRSVRDLHQHQEFPPLTRPTGQFSSSAVSSSPSSLALNISALTRLHASQASIFSRAA